MAFWAKGQPAEGTLVEKYLQSRGLKVPTSGVLKFSPFALQENGYGPAMLALVTNGETEEPVGIHRTFLAPDGVGKAPISQPRKMLGPCQGGVVRLAAHSIQLPLLVGEGIETSLSGAQSSGLPAWAALSASGLARLSLPQDVRDVIILADGDDPGERAAKSAALRWKREGRRVRIAKPMPGFDFNDHLTGLTAVAKAVEV